MTLLNVKFLEAYLFVSFFCLAPAQQLALITHFKTSGIVVSRNDIWFARYKITNFLFSFFMESIISPICWLLSHPSPFAFLSQEDAQPLTSRLGSRYFGCFLSFVLKIVELCLPSSEYRPSCLTVQTSIIRPAPLG